MARRRKPLTWSEIAQDADATTLWLAELFKVETALDPTLRPLWAAPNGEPSESGLDSCPCFHIRLKGFEADGHCWRVSCQPGGCCVHVRGDEKAAQRLKHLLDNMDWYGSWRLRLGADCRGAA